MISNTYAKAYTEVYEILNYLDEEELSKIPQEKIEFYKENRDKEYKFQINPTMNLDRQNFLRETYAIIISLFRDYIATDNQKVGLDKLLMDNQEIKENEKREKYNLDEIFKNRKKEIESNNLPMPIEVKKEKFLKQIIDYIKSWFNK